MIRPAAVFGLLLAASTAACLDDSITGTRPLSFTLTASSSTAVVGDSLEFEYDATGTGIYGVIMFYGDGVADTSVAESANQVERRGFFRYAYEEAGTFEVVGEVRTSIGNLADTVEVTINAPSS